MAPIVLTTFGFTAGRGEHDPDFVDFIASIPGTQPAFASYKDNPDDFLSRLPDNQGIILIGHSFGGNRSYQTALDLYRDGRSVDQLILLDPVHYFSGDDYMIPSNVGHADCWTNPNGKQDLLDNLLIHHPHKIGNESDLYINHTCTDGHGDFLHDTDIMDAIQKLIVARIAERAVAEMREQDAAYRKSVED